MLRSVAILCYSNLDHLYACKLLFHEIKVDRSTDWSVPATLSRFDNPQRRRKRAHEGSENVKQKRAKAGRSGVRRAGGSPRKKRHVEAVTLFEVITMGRSAMQVRLVKTQTVIYTDQPQHHWQVMWITLSISLQCNVLALWHTPPIQTPLQTKYTP